MSTIYQFPNGTQVASAASPSSANPWANFWDLFGQALDQNPMEPAQIAPTPQNMQKRQNVDTNVQQTTGIDLTAPITSLETVVQGWGTGIGLFLVALVLIGVGVKVLLEA